LFGRALCLVVLVGSSLVGMNGRLVLISTV